MPIPDFQTLMLPLLKLAVAMPITGALVACATKGLTDLDWTECFLSRRRSSCAVPCLSGLTPDNRTTPLKGGVVCPTVREGVGGQVRTGFGQVSGSWFGLRRVFRCLP